MATLMTALLQTLFFIPLTIGVYLSYRILAVTDLTVDATFVLGAAVFARLITLGFNQPTSIIVAIVAGALIGLLVAIMQHVVKINSLIASILAVFMLYSINFQIMQKPNISLLDTHTTLGQLQIANNTMLLIIMLSIIAVLILMLCIFLYSRAGLLLRAYGSNIKLLRSIGKSPLLFLIIGLSLSNALAAFCGVINAQINGYADLNMGMGMALTAIGSVVIGQHLMQKLFYKKNKFNPFIDCLSCFLGTYLYFTLVNYFLLIGINPVNLKLVLGLVLILFFGTAKYSRHRELYEQHDS